MKTTTVAALMAAFIASTGIAEAEESAKIGEPACCATGIPKQPAAAAPVADTAKPTGKKLPRLVDLGASKCVPCKMMAPILDDLKKRYEGRMDVEFVDVWKNPDAGKAHGIKMIPTQIFFSADGKEVFRHEGFFGKDDILAKWKELGVDVGAE